MNAASPDRFPLRTVHLDFHTGPDVPDVGADFDPVSFAETFRDAHVDSVTVFAKCHHGHLYYGTDRPERHPALPAGLDLLGEQVQALHAAGIRAPIYLSVQVDEWAARERPEWIAIGEDLRQVKFAPSAFEAGWHVLDMSSPFQDYMAEQLAEVLARFAPVDGIFLDMCWDQPSASRWAIDGAKRAGLDPSDPEHRARYARRVAREYMARFRDMVEPALREGAAMGVWFNSRPKTLLGEEAHLVRHVEVEALATGGWGYSYLPYVARFVRPLGLPALSHTGRFYRSWGDNAALKPRAALMYECCRILSLGMTNGVGDLLHPRARPSSAVYDLIGSVYSHIEACEPFVKGGSLASDTALVADPALGDNPGRAGIGAASALQQLRAQFDVVAPGADLSGYDVVVVPETTAIGDDLAAHLLEVLDAGGGVVLAAPGAISDGTPPKLMDALGVGLHGELPYSHVFLRPGPAMGLPASDLDTVVEGRGLRLAADGGSGVCGLVEPYFERAYDHWSGHSYTPPDRLSAHPAIVQKGRAVTIAVPIFEAFGREANPFYRELIGACLRLAHPRPLLRTGGPAHLETTVVRLAAATAVHLISFLPSRQAEGLDLVQDPFPLLDVQVSLRLEEPPARAILQPYGRPLPLDWSDGYATTTVSMSEGHGIVVFEHAGPLDPGVSL